MVKQNKQKIPILRGNESLHVSVIGLCTLCTIELTFPIKPQIFERQYISLNMKRSQGQTTITSFFKKKADNSDAAENVDGE